MDALERQTSLPLHDVALVQDEIVERQASLTRAIVVCGDLAGLEDKQCADAAGVDAATWSRIKSGQAHFPTSRLVNFQRVCGNWLPLQWMARDAGFGLVRLETVLERKLRETQQKLEKQEQENALLRSLITGVK